MLLYNHLLTLRNRYELLDFARSLLKEGETFDTAIPQSIFDQLKSLGIEGSFITFYSGSNVFGEVVNVYEFIHERLHELLRDHGNMAYHNAMKDLQGILNENYAEYEKVK